MLVIAWVDVLFVVSELVIVVVVVTMFSGWMTKR